MIELEKASLVYQDHGRDIFACQEIDLTVQPGEFLGILGPSGSGKSSLLYLLSGLKTQTSGEIRFENASYRSLSDRQRAQIRLKNFGFVFQYPYLIGYVSALENILLARPDNPNPEEAMKLLELVGLGHKSGRYPHELSGGERQRVCVARALMGKPKVVFGDEPTASLDHKTGTMVMSLLRDNRGEGTLVVVTHDPTMLEGADRIVQMVDGCLTQISGTQ